MADVMQAPHPIPAGAVVQGTPVNLKCPFLQMQARVTQKPTTLNLKVLSPVKYPGLEGGLDPYKAYAEKFKKLSIPEVKQDIVKVLGDSKDWWPADYGHYGPFMVRMAWHMAGTYRTSDGRGGANSGNQRFNPLDSWPDNGNLDKARRLLWPVKQKYGASLSWGDLFMLTGTVAMEDMGHKTFGFGGGRVDCWAEEEDAYWGEPESFHADLVSAPNDLENPLGATVMGLIYVNPEGPGGNPDPVLAAGHIRTTFGRMAMNDEETVALIAGGHTFGKCHGAAPGAKYQGPKPSAAAVEEQGFGWTSSFGTGKGKDTITSGLEGAWTAKPAKWDHGYFTNLFKYEWELHIGPGGAKQWRPKDAKDEDFAVPDAHEEGKKHLPMMLTTDLSLIKDPAYREISKKFLDDPDAFEDAFARAWFKLCHRDMGPKGRYLGSEVPEETLIWQDPIPTPTTSLVSSGQVEELKKLLMGCGLTPAQMIRTAWASACTFRQTDFRGGANGARIRLAPQNAWAVNDPDELNGTILPKYEAVQSAWNKENPQQAISLADLIVLAGAAAIEAAAGGTCKVPFRPGRGDASPEQTDAASFAVLEPTSDAFRNYRANAYQLVDRAHLLRLTAPEMAVLVAGLRVLQCNAGSVDPKLGCLTDTPGKLSNDFFVNLLSMDVYWTKGAAGVFTGRDRGTAAERWTASECDLVFGSNPELRAIAECYACGDAGEKFQQDFIQAWAKVMDNDRLYES